MVWLYDIGLFFYYLMIRVGSLFHPKARAWMEGRKNWRVRYASLTIPGQGPLVWFHCASLGEFEQGRPVMEKIREEFPETRILLTFFSPSGYKVQKKFRGADRILYLPIDTRKNARHFIEIFKPDLAIYVKYEFWYHYLHVLKKKGIPVFLVSGIFREDHIFFRWYGGLFRRTLHSFHALFVQNNFSKSLLEEAGVHHVQVTGDTRFDRVIQITERACDIEPAKQFSAGRPTIVCGSTWPEDEEIITRYINKYPEHFHWIIAPHEIHEEHIRQLEGMLQVPVKRISALRNSDRPQVLIIDNIGMLSTLYRYGIMAYVGGAFGKGLHNILEAATYGIPVLFGPRYHKFREAMALNYRGGAFSVQNYREFEQYIRRLRDHPEVREMSGKEAARYIHNSRGATECVMYEIRPFLQRTGFGRDAPEAPNTL